MRGMLLSSCTPPLPEDWCMRRMEWVGHHMFKRGYLKNEDEKKLLDASEGRDVLLRVM